MWTYAQSHQGRFPADDRDGAIAGGTWETLDVSRMRYRYVPARKAGVGSGIVAYEPGQFGERRLALCADGEVREMNSDQILEGEQQ